MSDEPDKKSSIWAPSNSKESRISAAKALLPAWFIVRMMQDAWVFGLMLTNGQIIMISSIEEVRQAKDSSIWIDVTLRQHKEALTVPAIPNLFGAPTARLKASINAGNIAMAFELTDT
jgi:hypothetical protein